MSEPAVRAGAGPRPFPERARAVFRAVNRAVRAVVSPVATVLLLGPLWLATSMAPWVFDRLAGFDPLRGPNGPSGWVPRRDLDRSTGRLWFADPSRVRPPWWRRVHRRVPNVMLLMACSAWGVNAIVNQPGTPRPAARNEAERIQRAQPWFLDVERAQGELSRQAHYSQFVGVEFDTYRSRYLNVTDGVRRSWQGRCRGRRYEVWMFGGSTMFGYFQPDDRTIASELAKVADRAGITLDVKNFGVFGEVSWQSAHRLERQLAGPDQPDAVIFYDGFNEQLATHSMDFAGRGGPTDFVAGPDATALRMLTDLNRHNWGTWSFVRRPKSVPTLSDGEATTLAIRQYAVAHRFARLLTEDRDLPFLHLYQPSAWSRPANIPGEQGTDQAGRDRDARFAADLPAGVIDISDALDDHRTPLYVDDVHPLAEANRYIAARIYRELTPTITAVRAARGGTPCP